MQTNLYADIPEDLPEELFQTILSRPNLRIERIVSRGHCSADGFWYDQEWDEWVRLMQGRAGLAFEGASEVRELRPGDHLLIPARRRHRVAWTAENQETIWLAVHVSPEQA